MTQQIKGLGSLVYSVRLDDLYIGMAMIAILVNENSAFNKNLNKEQLMELAEAYGLVMYQRRINGRERETASAGCGVTGNTG
jgi:hypothetical protein